MLKTSIYKIDASSSLPKYRQLINNLIKGIDEGELLRGEKIPSLNQICNMNNMSRDTVMMAFNELKTRGVIYSRPGKGYFIQTTQVEVIKRIFVLFDELNSFKEDMYNSFLQHLDAKTDVDIYFHHFNSKVFADLIENAAGNYTSYVIMPATFKNTAEIIGHLPPDKVYILDRKKEDLANYPSIYQDFENDAYEALIKNHIYLKKYQNFIMIHPGGKEPDERAIGFQRYAIQKEISYQIVQQVDSNSVQRNTCYLVPSDRMLVELIKTAKQKQYKLGSDIGIISFNDTVLKEVVADGISTISTDFFDMGKQLAEMIQSKSTDKIRNRWKFVRRNSI
ncbi:MAG: GntR family transcriptional regulator [Prolixibacteraceae bacterium]